MSRISNEYSFSSTSTVWREKSARRTFRSPTKLLFCKRLRSLDRIWLRRFLGRIASSREEQNSNVEGNSAIYQTGFADTTSSKNAEFVFGRRHVEISQTISREERRSTRCAELNSSSTDFGFFPLLCPRYSHSLSLTKCAFSIVDRSQKKCISTHTHRRRETNAWEMKYYYIGCPNHWLRTAIMTNGEQRGWWCVTIIGDAHRCFFLSPRHYFAAIYFDFFRWMINEQKREKRHPSQQNAAFWFFFHDWNWVCWRRVWTLNLCRAVVRRISCRSILCPSSSTSWYRCITFVLSRQLSNKIEENLSREEKEKVEWRVSHSLRWRYFDLSPTFRGNCIAICWPMRDHLRERRPDRWLNRFYFPREQSQVLPKRSSSPNQTKERTRCLTYLSTAVRHVHDSIVIRLNVVKGRLRGDRIDEHETVSFTDVRISHRGKLVLNIEKRDFASRDRSSRQLTLPAVSKISNE